MLDRVVDAIARHRMLADGDRVGVAVSGGADSVCLLHILLDVAPRWNLHLEVLHLDHGLRGGESDLDAEFVRELSERLDLPFHLRRADLASAGANLEQAARHARLAFFRERMEARRLTKVALGHTRNDQAETVLFRFLRGAGTAGLSGVRPVTGDGIIRPLIDVSRAEIECYLQARGLAWREDSTNCSRHFARNRIRHDLLPQLAREWNSNIVDAMAQTAEWAQAEERYWEAEIGRMASECCRRCGDALMLDVRRVSELPEAAARRLVRHAIELVKGDLRGIEFHHVTAILALTATDEGHGRCQAPGVDAFRSFEWLRIAARLNGEPRHNYRVALLVPGSTPVPASDSRIQTELVEIKGTNVLGEYVYNGEMGCIDWERISSPLDLRNWRPGDQYQPLGHAGEHKIKTLFHQARVPLWERRDWPVIVQGDEIIWSRRFGPAAKVAANLSTRVALKIEEQAGIGEAPAGV